MKNILQQSRHRITAFLFSLLSLLFVMAACDEPSKPNNGGGTTADTLAAPTITTQPASVTIAEGSTATLSVAVTAVTGVTFTYQWKKAPKGSTSFTDVAGATSANYTTPVLSLADSGVQYRVVVTATAAKLSSNVTSDVATLSVLPPTKKIVWTDINGIKRYADIPTNGILLWSILTATKTDIKSVDTIPSKVTSIGDTAFLRCTGLKSINIPSSVTSIGNVAFSGCIGFTSVTIPNGVTSIGEEAFSGCIALISIGIPTSVTSIGWGAFASCTALTSITIPNGVTSIEEYTFSACTALASVSIPSGVTSIGNGTFNLCRSLNGITIPASVDSIGNSAFQDCSALANVSMEATTPPTLGNDVFYNTPSALLIRVPDGSVAAYKAATNWRDYASHIYGHTEVVSKIVWTHIDGSKHYADVPADGILLGSTLTNNLTNIKSVDTIPSSITSIGQFAFSAYISLTSINIPSSVTSIGANAFAFCSALASITIPSSVTSIRSSAFSDCSALRSVRVEATTPPTAGGGMFDNTHANLSITVPTASVDAYKAAGGWSAYANQITGY